MDESAFSAAFCEFIRACIPSLQAAAVLVCMTRDRARGWDPAAIGSELRSTISIDRSEIERCIELFAARGLIVRGADRLFRLANRGLQEAHMRTLVQAYDERPVTLVQMIYALRDDKIRSFSDAFRLRKS